MAVMRHRGEGAWCTLGEGREVSGGGAGGGNGGIRDSRFKCGVGSWLGFVVGIAAEINRVEHVLCMINHVYTGN